MKSGKIQTGNAMVVKRITWPNELACRVDGKPAIYEELTLLLFLSRYVSVLDIVNSVPKKHDAQASERTHGR